MHARTADAAVNQKPLVPVARTQAEQQQIALRLLHLVDFRAENLRRKLHMKPGEKHSIQWHVRAPP